MKNERTILKGVSTLYKIIAVGVGAVIALVAVIVLWKDSAEMITMLN